MDDKAFLAFLVKKADFYEDENFFSSLVQKYGLKDCVKAHLLNNVVNHIFLKEKDFILTKIITEETEKYEALKELYPNKILFFKKGNFYECYNEDAEKVAAIYNVTPDGLDNFFKYTYRIPVEKFFPRLLTIKKHYGVKTF